MFSYISAKNKICFLAGCSHLTTGEGSSPFPAAFTQTEVRNPEHLCRMRAWAPPFTHFSQKKKGGSTKSCKDSHRGASAQRHTEWKLILQKLWKTESRSIWGRAGTNDRNQKSFLKIKTVKMSCTEAAAFHAQFSCTSDIMFGSKSWGWESPTLWSLCHHALPTGKHRKGPPSSGRTDSKLMLTGTRKWTRQRKKKADRKWHHPYCSCCQCRSRHSYSHMLVLVWFWSIDHMWSRLKTDKKLFF